MKKLQQARLQAAKEQRKKQEIKEQQHYESLGTKALEQAKANAIKTKEMKLKTAAKIAEQMKREREAWVNGEEARIQKRKQSKKNAAAKEMAREQENLLRIKVKQEKQAAHTLMVENRLRQRNDAKANKVKKRQGKLNRKAKAQQKKYQSKSKAAKEQLATTA